ncbi:hypothetical protein EYF80_046490 [Liparis tanakae]|uniref:Uncharacterized protein n=1 Tax=Liparis tanakae TaxID=230148 RepID=A0A4Z2FRK0_9TELE|nr:hypothetical protein EYF80_046490 [Liparis tanakae]
MQLWSCELLESNRSKVMPRCRKTPLISRAISSLSPRSTPRLSAAPLGKTVKVLNRLVCKKMK